MDQVARKFIPIIAVPNLSSVARGVVARQSLHRAALWLRRHRRIIMAAQWLVVVFYTMLVVLPAFMPLPPEDAHLWNDLRRFAQFAFWGVWWPGVMITTVLFGRLWCGLLCPEGSLTEWVSQYGRGRAVPRWLKWSGWPLFAFIATTVYGQLVSVYEYAQAALLVLGGSTVAALIMGLLYGRGRRQWCRYLCPASGVFALLARLAPLHYRVDRQAWNQYQGAVAPVNCAPLVDIRRMNSNAECHACGRCAGQRDAVTYAWRSPFAEVLDCDVPVRSIEAFTLLFGLLGVATAAFRWTISPLFRDLNQWCATWLVEHDYFLLLNNDAPWWLLTHYPEVGDQFTWLDGLLVLAFLMGGGLVVGGVLCWLCVGAAKLLDSAATGLTWQRLAMALLPLGAANVILGLSLLTISQLNNEHWQVDTWANPLRAALFALGVLGSLWLSAKLCLWQAQQCPLWRCLAALLLLGLPALWLAWVWFS